MSRSRLTRGRVALLAERYGVAIPGRHYVPCYWCGTDVLILIETTGAERLDGHPPQVKVTRWGAEVDHLYAVANGGTNAIENLVFACSPCNSSRGHKHHFPPRLAGTR
jgi:hypothetical protein